MEDAWWQEIDDLDDDQKAVIGLPLEGSYLAKGPPGSGKTNLLLLRANYMVNSDKPNIAVVVFNRTLQEFIRSGAHRYDFEHTNVVTSAHLFGQLLREADVKVDRLNDFAADREARVVALSEVIKGIQAPLYDAIFLDEAQDYLPDEIAIFKKVSENLFMVCDSRQRIYNGNDVTNSLEQSVDEVVTLRFHYRNGRSICELADRVGSKFTAGYAKMLPGCNYKEAGNPSKVEMFKGALAEQISETARRIADQRRVYPNSILGVVAPRLAEVAQIAERLEALGLGNELCVQTREDGYQPIDRRRPIWVSTIHSAKGLEFRALHMLSMEHARSFGASQKRLVFTGLTRAKTSLVIYHDGALPPYLAGALAEMAPASGPKPLGVAFGKR